LREHSMIKDSQHRFRQGRLCSTAPRVLWRYYCCDR